MSNVLYVNNLEKQIAAKNQLIAEQNQQLANSQKREVMLRKQVSADVAQILKLLDVIDSVRGPTGATEGIQEHAQHIEKVALAATADLDGLILCHAEPAAIVYRDYGGNGAILQTELADDEPLYRAWEPK